MRIAPKIAMPIPATLLMILNALKFILFLRSEIRYEARSQYSPLPMNTQIGKRIVPVVVSVIFPSLSIAISDIPMIRAPGFDNPIRVDFIVPFIPGADSTVVCSSFFSFLNAKRNPMVIMMIPPTIEMISWLPWINLPSSDRANRAMVQ